ncbi:unnamed protein product, partial [marine sediment metagenome]
HIGSGSFRDEMRFCPNINHHFGGAHFCSDQGKREGHAHLPQGTIMLVLSRKVGERLWIGENISITVVKITGGGVRIGIEAPTEMPVVREELKIRMERQLSENTDSAPPAPRPPK